MIKRRAPKCWTRVRYSEMEPRRPRRGPGSNHATGASRPQLTELGSGNQNHAFYLRSTGGSLTLDVADLRA
jgi:hypothetical protein